MSGEGCEEFLEVDQRVGYSSAVGNETEGRGVESESRRVVSCLLATELKWMIQRDRGDPRRPNQPRFPRVLAPPPARENDMSISNEAPYEP